MKKTEGINQVLLNILLVILSLLIIYPFLMLISASFSNEKDIAFYGYRLIAKRFDLSAYKYVFENTEMLFNAYKITLIFSFLSMVLGVFLMSLIAYPLSKQSFRGRRAVSLYLYFTMLFSGGLVPTYILITQYLRLNNTLWVYILPHIISPWYVFMIRTFFSSIPVSIIESAQMDGAREYQVFYRIVFPLSKPVIAAVALFVFLAKWNDWFTSMIYIDNNRLISLQFLLQSMLANIEILKNADSVAQGLVQYQDIPAETVRMAMAVLVAGPALIVFPFFQKYFVKGITVGAVKG